MLLRHSMIRCHSGIRYLSNLQPQLTNGATYDMIIVGGGMVGFGLAALAASSNLLKNKRILLVERAPNRRYELKETYETRTVALNQASQKMLESVGAWKFITARRLQPVTMMKIWETRSDAHLTFARNPLAHIVENNLVTESLRQLLEEDHRTANVTVSNDTLVEEIQLPREGDEPQELVQLTLRSSKEGASNESYQVKTSLLVGADGHQSAVRKASGIPVVSWDHGQSAVVAVVRMDNVGEEFTAWQRFLPTGPLALLPMPSNHCAVVWSTTNSESDRLLGLSDVGFVEELNMALTLPGETTPAPGRILGQLGAAVANGVDYLLSQTQCEYEGHSLASASPLPPRIQQLQPDSRRAQFPLGFQHANCYHAPCRVVLVGDAAHRILPLAGQGVNLGFGDAASLIHSLEESVSLGAEFGNPSFLRKYTTERQRAVLPVAATMEVLNLLYSTNVFFGSAEPAGTTGPSPLSSLLPASLRVLAGLRAAGVDTVQSSSLLKTFLMEAAVTGQIGVPAGSL